MKKILMGAVAVIALSTSAHAQSYIDNTRKSSVTGINDSPLSGLYLGGYGGYSWNGVDTPAGGTARVEGEDYGLFMGYKLDQYLQNNIGINGAVEAHYGWSNASGRNIDKEREWGVSFRPGISISENINPYGIIGYRNTKFDTPAGGSNWHDGFELGLGTEIVSWDRVGVRLDYSHVWYGAEGGYDPEEDNVRAGLLYRF